MDGRGHDVGPDLSVIGRADRRHVLEAILQPSNLVAPHYQAWAITTTNGKTSTGLMVKTNLDETTYLDAEGNLFTLKAQDVAEMEPAKASIMPAGLVDLFTDQELRDLLAYLMSAAERFASGAGPAERLGGPLFSFLTRVVKIVLAAIVAKCCLGSYLRQNIILCMT